MKKLPVDLPVHVEDGVRVVHPWTRCGTRFTMEADDYAAIRAGKRSLTFKLKGFNGIDYVTHPVMVGPHWRPYPVARTIMQPAEDEIVLCVDRDPLRLVRANLQPVKRGTADAWRTAQKYFGDTPAEVD